MIKVKTGQFVVKEDYLKELKKRGKKNETIHLDVPKSEEGYPRFIISSLTNGSYLVILKSTGMPPCQEVIDIDVARMIGAYAEGMAEAKVLAEKNKI